MGEDDNNYLIEDHVYSSPVSGETLKIEYVLPVMCDVKLVGGEKPIRRHRWRRDEVDKYLRIILNNTIGLETLRVHQKD